MEETGWELGQGTLQTLGGRACGVAQGEGAHIYLSTAGRAESCSWSPQFPFRVLGVLSWSDFQAVELLWPGSNFQGSGASLILTYGLLTACQASEPNISMPGGCSFLVKGQIINICLALQALRSPSQVRSSLALNESSTEDHKQTGTAYWHWWTIKT